MTRLSLYITLLMFLILQPLSDVYGGVVERNNFLSEMLSLAEGPKAYFIIDLGENKITLMSKGINIREWTIDEMGFIGEPLPVKPFLLEGKSINLSDLRNNVDIEDNKVEDSTDNDNASNNTDEGKTVENKTDTDKKTTKYEVVAMEIDDMPSDYQLFLNGGVAVSVKSGSEGGGIFYSLKRLTYYPFLALYSSFKKNTFTRIDIFFKDKTEAQALFWAFTDETECIILPPGSENREDYKL